MTKISHIWQSKDNNILIVEYKSGQKRYCYLGDHIYIMTKTQRDFLENAHKTEYDYYTEWR